ncbi:MAG: hypothetical protein R3F49_18875 [Planctomycetota bacterium]
MALVLEPDWEAAGHALSARWVDLDARFGPWVFGALFGLIVARALWRARRYRAVDVLSDADRAALRGRVAAAEARTDAELVVVVVEASDSHPDASWKAAVATLALGSLLFAGAWEVSASSWGSFAWARPAGYALVQVALGALGFGLARGLADFRRGFVTERRATEVAEEQALQELQRLDLTAHGARNAVLLFVSLFEQRVVVLADSDAHAAAGTAAWVAVDDAVLAALRGGAAREGALRVALERGIDAIADVLEQKLPRTADGPNRVRDDIEVRRS